MYIDSDNRFQFYYPSYYEITKIKRQEKEITLINHNIMCEIKESSFEKDIEKCRGDCDVIENREDLLIANYKVRKIKGYIGAIGGNIPEDFIIYEIKLPNSDKYFNFSLYALPQDESYFSLLEKYPELKDFSKRKTIAHEEEKILEKIISTLQFN